MVEIYLMLRFGMPGVAVRLPSGIGRYLSDNTYFITANSRLTNSECICRNKSLLSPARPA